MLNDILTDRVPYSKPVVVNGIQGPHSVEIKPAHGCCIERSSGVYCGVYMHRTNIYLTDEQERALDARARAEGRSRSAVLREILDRELTSPPVDGDLQEAFAALADGYEHLVGGLFDDDPDLRIER